jgi:hypothetical protein
MHGTDPLRFLGMHPDDRQVFVAVLRRAQEMRDAEQDYLAIRIRNQIAAMLKG